MNQTEASPTDLALHFSAPPGLEPELLAEARALGLRAAESLPGGVVARGGWPDVWRANLWLRGAGRVSVTLDAFRVAHLAQLDKRARRVDWAAVLRADAPIRVEASCRKSRIYHSGAAAERVANAIAATLGAPIVGAPTDAETEPDGLRITARIEDDLCTIGVDTSGAPLHKRGFKQAVAKAPLRETMAALLLRACGYDGSEPVLDPMCGSGTILLEAAEIAAGLAPGRSRGFAFERLATFDAAAWKRLRAEAAEAAAARADALQVQGAGFHGFDRDAGAVEAARANAARAGLAARIAFARQPIAELARPEGPPGLVLVNPPYGERIGEAADLRPLYNTLGRVLRERFAGWRVGLVTSDARLARATGLPFGPPGPPVPHGALTIRLWRTGRLG